MAETRLTPGPWSIRTVTSSIGQGFNGEAVCVFAGDTQICGTVHHITRVTEYGDPNERYSPFPHYSGDEPIPASANAHLIAAAPALYEALEKIAAIQCGVPGHSVARCCGAEFIARAALTAARGEGGPTDG